jgi:hypothetical protein
MKAIETDSSTIRFDKTALSLAPLSDDSEDRAYWLSRTPQERLQYDDLEHLP